MRNKIVICSLLALTGCSGMNNAQTDAVGGGLLGAAIGAIAGGPRHALAGAAIGGAVGAGGGALVGNAEDQRNKRWSDQAAAAANAQAARQMKIEEVVQMAQQGQSDSVIIGQINATGSVFQLTADDVNYLHQQRVSDQVITFMQSRRYATVVPARPVYVYDRGPYYGPPPPVGGVVVIGR